MAEKRMFAKTIIDSDAFLDMPATSQCLYFHLAMRADDDGFINNPRKIQRFIGSTNDDLKLLIAKRFIIPFESGVVVIKHWKIHNYIRADRKKDTVYTKEMKMLTVKDNGSYTLNTDDPALDDTEDDDYLLDDGQVADDCLTDDGQVTDKRPHSIDKISIDKEYIPYRDIVSYLNEKAGTSYRPTSKKTQTLIKARFSEKFTLEDFKAVIDIKAAEWLGTEMQKYLRPETLFGTKFESYLNQKSAGKAETQPSYFKPLEYEYED